MFPKSIGFSSHLVGKKPINNIVKGWWMGKPFVCHVRSRQIRFVADLSLPGAIIGTRPRIVACCDAPRCFTKIQRQNQLGVKAKLSFPQLKDFSRSLFRFLIWKTSAHRANHFSSSWARICFLYLFGFFFKTSHVVFKDSSRQSLPAFAFWLAAQNEDWLKML